MKTNLCACALAVFACIFSSSALAQPASDEPPAFNTIRTPASPAFTFLGASPTSIERPNTVADFALSLAKSAKDFESVPQNFAIEVSPFWLVGAPSLTWQADAKRNVHESLLRTLAISAATAETGVKDAPVTSLAVGARTSLLSGTLTEETETQLEALESHLTVLAERFTGRLNAELAFLDAEMERNIATARSNEERQKIIEAFQAKKAPIVEAVASSKEYTESPEYKRTEKLIEAFAAAREGFIVELAAAGRWAFSEAVWSRRDFNRWGFWVTPSFLKPQWSVVGVARYTRDDEDDSGTAFDWGTRAIVTHDRYAWSLEYVRRTFPDVESKAAQYRLVGVAEYELREKTWLSASFGRDHNDTSEGSLVAQLGLSFNFAKERFLMRD